MKKAVIDYNFHNYQQSFTEKMKPIVESAIHFIKECADEAGGKITFNRGGTNGSLKTFVTENGNIIVGVENTSEKCTISFIETRLSPPESILNINDINKYIILDLAQYLYEN